MISTTITMKTFLICCFVLWHTSLYAQPDYIPYQQGEKWGYMNTTKKTVLQPQYDACSFFNIVYGGLVAKASKNGKFGLIDKQGKAILKFEYQSIESLLPNVAKIQVNNKYRLAVFGQKTSTTNYDSIALLGSQYFRVGNQQKYGLVDGSGKVLIPIQYQAITTSSLAHLLLVRKESFTGVFDIRLGREIVPPIYEEIQVIDDQQFLVNKSGWGLINHQHQTLIPTKFYKITIQDGFYKVTDGQNVGYYNAKGKLIVPVSFPFAVKRHGLPHFRVLNDVHQMAVFDDQGKMVKPFSNINIPNPGTIYLPDENSLFSGGSSGSIRVHRDPLLPVPFQDKTTQKWGFRYRGFRGYDKPPHIAAKYDQVMPFDLRLKMAKVKYKGNWGYVYINGEAYFK